MTPPATVGFISVGFENVSFIRPTFPIEAGLTIPIPLRTLEAVLNSGRLHLQQPPAIPVLVLAVVEIRISRLWFYSNDNVPLKAHIGKPDPEAGT